MMAKLNNYLNSGLVLSAIRTHPIRFCIKVFTSFEIKIGKT